MPWSWCHIHNSMSLVHHNTQTIFVYRSLRLVVSTCKLSPIRSTSIISAPFSLNVKIPRRDHGIELANSQTFLWIQWQLNLFCMLQALPNRTQIVALNLRSLGEMRTLKSTYCSLRLCMSRTKFSLNLVCESPWHLLWATCLTIEILFESHAALIWGT